MLSGLSLDICPGERVALTGANGAGKSTLIRLLPGELAPMEGTVSRAGGLVVSYIPEMPDQTPRQIAREQLLPMDFFLMLLRKLDLPRERFDRSFSLGQHGAPGPYLYLG